MTPVDAERLLRLAAGPGGPSVAHARLLRSGEVTIFGLGEDLVAEVCTPDLVAAARYQADVSDWLAAAGVGAVRTAPRPQSPVCVEDHAVTFWRALPAHRPGDYDQIAAALRRLHGLPRPDHPHLPPVDSFRRVEHRIARSVLLPRSDRRALLSRLDDARGAYTRLPAGLPPTPVHGDAWAGNIVALADGTVILRDLERVAIGPPEWDLVSTAIDHTTFGVMSAEQYAAFSETYGYDVIAWPGFATLLDIRELRVVAFALTAAEGAAHLVDQARMRVRDYLAGARPWPGWAPL